MTNKELKSLIKLLRSTGVVSYECNGVKLLLDPAFNNVKSTKRSLNRIAKDSNDLQEQVNGLLPQMTDEDWLIATNAPTAEDEQVQ